MRKVVVSEFVSLDGVMEDPGGAEGFAHGGWTFKFDDPDGMRYKLEETLGHEALLLGRVTYEGFAAAWPSVTDDVGFAEKMNGMPKYVVSSSALGDLAWSNSTLLGGEVADSVTTLKEQPGGDILVAGSCTLVQALLAEGLVDELRLMVFPIVLGSGKRLFGASADPSIFELVDAKTLRSGTLILTYRPAGDGADGGAIR
jgi:dihydrofolate reductase